MQLINWSRCWCQQGWCKETNTFFFLAAQKNHADICNILIENGAFVNIKDATGKTPLLIGASKSLEETCKKLILNGADPFEYDNFLIDTLCSDNRNMADMCYKWRVEFGKMIIFFTWL